MSFLELISEKASYFAPSLRSGIGIPAAKDKIQLLIRAAPPLIEQYHIRQCFPNKVKMCPKKGVQKRCPKRCPKKVSKKGVETKVS